MDGLYATIIFPSLVGTMEASTSKIAVCSSKVEFLSDVISEKLTVAAREIFAALLTIVTEHETEPCTPKIGHPIPTKPDPDSLETSLKDNEIVCEAEEGGASAEEEEHKSNIRVVDTWTMSMTSFTEDKKEKESHRHPEEAVEEAVEEDNHVNDCHPEEPLGLPPPAALSDRSAGTLPREEHINLQIRILKDASLSVITRKDFEEYPVHRLQCPGSLQRTAFVSFIKAECAHLAPHTPFAVLRAMKIPNKASYKLLALRPRCFFRAAWKNSLCLRPKETKKDRLEEDSSTRVDSVVKASGDGEEEAQPEDQNQEVNIRIRILEDPTIQFMSKDVLDRFPIQALRCPRSLKEEEFLRLLRSTFPQLAPDRPFQVLRNRPFKRLQRINLKPLTPQEICRFLQNPTFCLRLTSPHGPQEKEKEEDPQNSEVHNQTPLEGEGVVRLNVCLLQDVETPQEIHQLDCPGDLQDPAFLDLLRSRFPQLRNQTLELLTRTADRLLPVKTVKEIHQSVASCYDSVLYVRVQDGSGSERPDEVPLRDCPAAEPSRDESVELKIDPGRPSLLLQDPVKIKREEEGSGGTAHRNSSVWTGTQSSSTDGDVISPYVCLLRSPKLTASVVKNETDWTESRADLSGYFQLACKVCRREHQSVCGLIKHASAHVDDGSCGVCGENFSSPEELNNHFLTHQTCRTRSGRGRFFIAPSDPRMHCSGTCQRDFRTKLTLTNHMKLHLKTESLQCGANSWTGGGNDQTQSRNSSRKFQKNNPFKCSKCDRTFRSKVRLEKHVKVHGRVQPYTCDVCGVQFHYSISMRKHRLTHMAGK